MAPDAYSAGYYAGLINDRENPFMWLSPGWVAWQIGNSAGVSVHCAVVEAVYLAHG